VHAVLGLPAAVVAVESPHAGERLPIEGGYVLEVRRSAVGRGLMRDELVYLEGVATEVSHRLDSLAFESERRSLLLREERLRHSLTEAELKALRAQVDPHFLFNTLNTIADLISSDAETAEAMTEQLAEFFRYTLARQGPVVSTFEQEFEFVRRYLAIEQVRFGDRLRVELRCEPSVARHPVPALLLQPLVENAIRHGLAPKLDPGHLIVSAVADDRGTRISVEDDGVGMPPVKSGAGVGLRNVSDRIQAMYGSAARLDIARGARGVGTRVDIYMPLAAGETALAGTAVCRVIEP
jgi:two-component system, LytTR family, sensor kinase